MQRINKVITRNQSLVVKKKPQYAILGNKQYKKFSSETNPNQDIFDISEKLDNLIQESIPKIQKQIDGLNQLEMDCIKILKTGAMSHGAISYPAHVSIAAGVNLMRVFIHAKENKYVNRLLQAIGPQKTFTLINKLNIYYGPRSVFWSSTNEMSLADSFEKEYTGQVLQLLGEEDAKQLILSLPNFEGPMSNSGEGGEIYLRDGTIQQSLQRQIASGRFGVTLRYAANANLLEIKINQGAKPGVGGQLPGMKVTKEIALARGATPGISLISPPPHHDIYSIEDLRQLIFDLRSANPHAHISVKLASNQNCETVALGIAKCFAKQFENDRINVSISGPGGTGAATVTDKHEINQPYELGIIHTHQMLMEQGLRDRVTLTCSGGIQTGLDVLKAVLLGSNYVEIGTSPLVALGCLMAKVCHLGTCPTGIATTNYDLINSKFKGTPDGVSFYMVKMAKSMASYLQQYGITNPKDAVGRTDLLKVKKESVQSNYLRQTLDLIKKIKVVDNQPFTSSKSSSSNTEKQAIERIEKGEKDITLKASNNIKAFGARIGYYNYFKEILKEPVTIRFEGTCMGQSFGYLLGKNITLVTERANDGAGKSLCGGELFIKNFCGNGLAYGATEGFIAVGGKGCGDRGMIRLSGFVRIVIRRAGDSACNFMTGGSVTILGDSKHYQGLSYKDPELHVLESPDTVGPNFGSGFTGGKIIISRGLYDELKSKGYIAKACLDIPTEDLTSQDLKLLMEDLTKYQSQITDGLVQELLQGGESLLSKYFIKLEAKAPVLANLPPPIEHSQKAPKMLNIDNIKQDVEFYKEEEREKDSCGVGMVVKLNHKPDRQTIDLITNTLKNSYHRGSVGTDELAGDGGGICIYGNRPFLQKKFPDLTLEKGEFGTIMMSVPADSDKSRLAQDLLFKLLGRERLAVLGQRDVPTNSEVLGKFGKENMINYLQFIVEKPAHLTQHTFENALSKVRLRFEFTLQNVDRHSKNRAHILSSSSHYIIYTSTAQGRLFTEYFLDLQDPDFVAYAGITHERFATNTEVHIKNVQPLPRISNNGENNNIKMIELLLKEDPSLEDILGIRPDFTGMSDSQILSTYLDYFILKYFEKTEVTEESPYVPDEMGKFSQVSQFYNVFGVPFEGPNTSVITVDHLISLIRDRNGFRPLVGIVNNDYVYAGSELGCIDIEGEAFRLRPGRALFINLEKGEFSFSNMQSDQKEYVENLWLKAKRTFQEEEPDQSLIPQMTSEQLEISKLRAGWNDEVDENVMSRLLTDGNLTQSMGDHGPPEHFVNGPYLDLSAHFKGKFAQVTNPALAKREEIVYMSSNTFIGEKPDINELIRVDEVNGYIIESPIVDNRQMALIEQAEKLKIAKVSINYPLKRLQKGLNTAINQIATKCLRLVLNEKKNFIILTDLIDKDDSDFYGPIPGVLAAAVVDRALLKVGLRRKATICIQSADIMTGPHVAQAISIGGADIVNPYLAMIRDPNSKMTEQEYQKQDERYKEALKQEVFGFMARMGISSFTAYRGAKNFEAEGLDQELANMYGVHSRYSGFGINELAHLSFARYSIPRKKGLGRYDEILRKMIWRPEITQFLIKAVKNEDDGAYKTFEKNANYVETGPSDWLDLVKPQKWSESNPIPISIIGGGAAGFMLCQEILESNIPAKITIIDKNIVNKVGLIGDGVAPDHPGTRKQADLLKEVLNDDRVSYFGGISVSEHVTINQLKQRYSVVFDARGSGEDIKLGIPGENSPLVLPASTVYKAYNGTFNPFEKSSWPLNNISVNPAIGIIGMGNVSADIVRILFQDPDQLEHTAINKDFLRYQTERSPPIIYLFARGNPTNCKIGFKELGELEKLNIWMTAKFDLESIPKDLSEEEQKYLDFFMKIRNNKESVHAEKRLYFYFQFKPQKITHLINDVEILFKNRPERFIVKNLITSLGRKPSELNKANVDYTVGWATGVGGNLLLTEESVKSVFAQFQKDFETSRFNTVPEITETDEESSWELKAAVNKQEFSNILEYIKQGKSIDNIQDFHLARNSKGSSVEGSALGNQITLNPQELNITPSSSGIAIYDGEQPHLIQPINDEDILTTLKDLASKDANLKKLVPEHECDGVGTCGTCFMRFIDNEENSDIKNNKKEKDLLRINGISHGILTCQHKTKDMANKILFHMPLKK